MGSSAHHIHLWMTAAHGWYHKLCKAVKGVVYHSEGDVVCALLRKYAGNESGGDKRVHGALATASTVVFVSAVASTQAPQSFVTECDGVNITTSVLFDCLQLH